VLRASGPDEKAGSTGREVERVTRIDQDLAVEGVDPGKPDNFFGRPTEHREHDDVAELGRFFEPAHLSPKAGAQ
jgi:hypothetical protein